MEEELNKYLIPDLANIVLDYANPYMNRYDLCVRELNIRILNNDYFKGTDDNIRMLLQPFYKTIHPALPQPIWVSYDQHELLAAIKRHAYERRALIIKRKR